MIKLLIGGSPCQKWSIAQKNRETTCSGEGWELFKNYLIAKELFKPDYFLYENNQSAADEIKNEIQKSLNGKLYNINSNLVSPQNRARFYVSNIPNIEIPKDKGLFVKDIIDFDYIPEKSYILKNRIENPKIGRTGLIKLGHINNSDSQGNRVYSIDGKGPTLCSSSGGLGAKTGLYEINGICRKLNINEARKMQNIPNWVEFPVSENQIYKQLGNGWTIDVIKNFFQNLPENEEIVILSLYDGMGCGYIALKELGLNIKKYISVEIEKYCNQTLDKNIPDRIGFLDAFDVRNKDSELYKEIVRAC